jgi:hypothetical protein
MEALLNYQDDLCSRIFKARNNFKKTPRDRLTKHYFESKLQALEQLWAEFRDGHKQLMTTSEKAKIKATPYITEETYDKTEEEYTRYVCELKDKLAEDSQPSQSKTSSENGSIKASVVKLPKISIPNFSGQYHEWTTFRDLFTSMIHNNSSLDSVQKMQYLKSYLTGEAEQLLRNIPVSDTNYERCWSQLEARYNNKRYLSHCILKRLLGQKTATTESAAFLKDLMDTSTDCLSALANLEINVSTWDIMVIHLLTLKLDPESRRQWELNVATNSASDALPTFQQFKEFLTSRYRALEFIEPKSAGRPSTAYGKAFSSSNYNKPNVLHVASAPTLACEYCSGPHKLCFCKQFASEDFVKRHEFVTNNRMCYNCLGSNHSVRFCQKTTSCRICKRKHHSLLHPNEVSTSTASSETQGQAVEGRGETTLVATENTSIETAPIVSCFTTGIRDEVLLATALVKVQSNVGGYQVIRALLDQGSQASFVTEAVVQALGIKKIPIKGSISGLGGDDTSVVSKYMVQLKVQSLTDPNFNIVLKAYVLSKITTYLPSKRVAVPEWLELKQLALADPTYSSPNKIDVLLGAEVYGQILKEGVLKGPKGTPVAQCTALGWILSGPVSSGSPNKNVTVLHARVSEDELLKRFWEIEAEPSGQIKRFTAEEQKCEELFAATTVRNEEGRYVVKLPFRDYDPSCKGSSREIAAKRLYTLEKKLGKDPGLKARYVDVIREYQQLGHMVPVEEPDRKLNEAIYLPHHAVIREDKSTTKVRVVFDASCKNVKGVSLNDLLMTGPTLQPDLRHIIMCWRSYPVCLVADIIKMYRMVRVAEEDTDFQRILWRENPEQEIKDYKLLTVTFGTASAPYLAVKALNQVAYDHKDTYLTAASRVHREFYMDDLMTGCETIEEGLKLYREMKDLLNEGGFVLQKWASNKKELSREINQRERENKEPDDEKDNLEIKTDSIVKILGLTWNRDEDEFQYSVKLPPLSPPATKRKIISDVSRLFDPLGWLAPCVIKAKIFIQRLWISGIGWDEEPPADILQDWLTYREQLAYLVNFRIPRWQHTNLDDAEVELHGFSDASNAAYAAVIYLRVVKASGDINVSLITAKTRVSPVKQISIPRLELCGAVLAAKLLKEVAEVLEIPKQNLRAWTDSTVVLAWLNKHPSNWKTFVANRVSEILTTMDASQWSHVPTKENPADCASRGIRPAELNEYNLWKFGPRLLYSEVITYAKPKNNDTNLEKSTKVHLGVVEEPFWNKYSSLTKLIRVVAYCRRFLKKHESHRNQSHTKHLQRWELDEAMTTCVKICQQASFKPEIAEIKRDGYISSKTSKIRSLTPFLENGILRVGGRLENASEPATVRHPTILPCDSHLSKLIVADAHNRTLHGEQRAMLNYLRSAYWIVRAKELVKHHIRKCISCIRHKAQIQTQLMGALPQTRVTPARAFIHSGVDYAGPIQLRTSKGRGHHSYKGYICLFICMVTKAIHLEVVSELTSRGFLEAFKRFIARRGRCLEIYSDNGTNFVGAAKELKVLFNAERSSVIPEIVETLASSGTAWHFIPPKSPNFGGLWEAGIKSTKYHIKRVIGDSTLTYEEMSTLLSQIEACLNSRPISVIPSSSDEPNPLTPGHFLIGEPLVTVPETNYESSNVSSLKRWQLTQRMLQQFWRRWSNECLTHYLHRYRWAHQVPEPKVGDVVLVKEDDLPPTKWLFGRITQKHAGSDLLTRVVTIKCKDALIKRPTSKLCILPVTE